MLTVRFLSAADPRQRDSMATDFNRLIRVGNGHHDNISTS